MKIIEDECLHKIYIIFDLILLIKKWSEQSSEQQARFKNIINEILLFVNSLLN